MNSVGIVAEYNPLHNGHVYHIEQARQKSGCDAVVVAMSGDYVQRGEPAVLDKWTRAALALSNGADLVIEIPVLACLGNAGQYARAGVDLLEAAGCSHIAFGSECGDLYRLSNVAELLNTNADVFAEKIAGLAREGLSFPAARELAYFEVTGCMPEDREILNNPNDTLAVEYLRAVRNMIPVCIRRMGSGYNQSSAASASFDSAAAIRKMIYDGGDPAGRVPMNTLGALTAGPVTDCDMWLGLLSYVVLSRSAQEIDSCPSGGEGLGNLMKKEIYGASSWEGFITAVKSRRYTYTRLSRLAMQLILGIFRNDFTDYSPAYIRVLGFTDAGRDILRELKNSSGNETAPQLPLITNINKEASGLTEQGRRMLELDIHAADIYNLVTGRDTIRYSDHRMRPRKTSSSEL